MFDVDVDSQGRGIAILTPDCPAAKILVAINDQMIFRRLSDPDGAVKGISTQEIMKMGLVPGKRDTVSRDLMVMKKRLGLVTYEHLSLNSDKLEWHGTMATLRFDDFWRVTDFGSEIADRLTAGEKEIELIL